MKTDTYLGPTRFKLKVVIIVLLFLVLHSVPSLATDNRPSDLALLLQKAFAEVNAPGKELFIDAISFYDGLVITVHWPNLIRIYDGTQWVDFARDEFFAVPLGEAVTVFEEECPAMGLKKSDVLAFYDTRLPIGEHYEMWLFEITGGESLFSVYGFLRDFVAVRGVASIDCQVVLLRHAGTEHTENFVVVSPDPNQFGVLPLKPSDDPPRFTGYSTIIPARNGVDGLLDPFVPSDEFIDAVELTWNERGALSLIISNDLNVHLIEFEKEGPVHTVIPLRGL